MRLRDHEKEELSFYSKATTDIEFLFPFGWGDVYKRQVFNGSGSCHGGGSSKE